MDLLPICVAALWRWCCCLPPPCLPVVPLCAAPFRTALPLSRTCTAPCTALQLQVAVHPGPGLCGLAARGRPAAGWVSVWVLGRRCLGVRAWRPHHHQALPLSAALCCCCPCGWRCLWATETVPCCCCRRSSLSCLLPPPVFAAAGAPTYDVRNRMALQKCARVSPLKNVSSEKKEGCCCSWGRRQGSKAAGHAAPQAPALPSQPAGPPC